MNIGHRPPAALSHRYRALADTAERRRWIAGELGIALNTLANLCAGFPVMASVLSVAESRIDHLESQDAQVAA